MNFRGQMVRCADARWSPAMTFAREIGLTELLDTVENDSSTAAEILPQVYGRLRALAQQYLRAERRDHTLQATAVVHEAYARLVGHGDVNWDSPVHFFAAASEAMRRVLVDHARGRGRLKRGGDRKRLELGDVAISATEAPDEFLLLDEAIQRLAERDAAMADVVRLRYFVGLEIAETAQVLGISAPTVKRRWQWARTWLYREMSRGGADHD